MTYASCLAVSWALAITVSAEAGPLYLTSEPGAVAPEDVVFDVDPFALDDGAENFGMRTANAISATDDPVSPVPEPASLLLLGVGIAAAALRRRQHPVG